MDILGPRSQTLGTWLAFFVAAGWAVYELRKDDQLPTGATISSRLLPILLIVTLFTAAAMHVIAAVINRHQPKAAEAKSQGVDPRIQKETGEKRVSTVPHARHPVTEAKEVHAECEKKIARLLESEEKHAMRATAHEEAFKTFRKEYAVTLAVADDQKAEIGKFVEVMRVCTHDPKLDDPMPTIKWEVRLKNRSVHRISLDGEVGPLFFEGHKLTEHKDVLENKVMGLYPDKEGSIIFEQRLSTPEVNLIKSVPDGKFEFDKVMLYAKRSSPNAEHVPADRVVIFSRFRATLGRCSDERSQAAEELSAQVDSLKAELREARLKLAAIKLEQGS